MIARQSCRESGYCHDYFSVHRRTSLNRAQKLRFANGGAFVSMRREHAKFPASVQTIINGWLERLVGNAELWSPHLLQFTNAINTGKEAHYKGTTPHPKGS